MGCLTLKDQPPLVTPLAFCGAADGSDFPTLRASAKEPVAAIGLQPRNAHARRHLEFLQHLSGPGVHSSDVGLATFGGAVPQFPIDPRDAGDEAIGCDRPKNLARLRIDLIDLPVAIVPDPE